MNDRLRIMGLAFAAVVFFWIMGARKRLQGLRLAVAQAWGQIDEQLKRRHATLGPLVEVLREPLATEISSLESALSAEAQVLLAAEALRRKPVSSDLLMAWLSAESVSAAALGRLRALVEYHPELPHHDQIAPALQTLKEIEQRLVFARQLFNEAAQHYNLALAQFPTRLLVRLFGLEPAGRC